MIYALYLLRSYKINKVPECHTQNAISGYNEYYKFL